MHRLKDWLKRLVIALRYPDHLRTGCSGDKGQDVPWHCRCWMSGRAQCCVCERAEVGIDGIPASEK